MQMDSSNLDRLPHSSLDPQHIHVINTQTHRPRYVRVTIGCCIYAMHVTWMQKNTTNCFFNKKSLLDQWQKVFANSVVPLCDK